MNDLRNYQKQASKTVTNSVLELPPKERLSYFTLGLVGEAGEVANKVKKHLRGDKDFQTLRDELVGEIGDVLWYLALTVEAMDLDLSEMASFNLRKLADRKARGTLQGDGDNR